MKVLFDHQLVCHRDDNGSFVACGPAIAGCHAVGPTSELAQQERHNVFCDERRGVCGAPADLSSHSQPQGRR